MPKISFAVLGCLLPLATFGDVALPKDDPVPGGVAVIALADRERPQVHVGEQRVMVVGVPGDWHAVVGIGLDVAPGAVTLHVDATGVARSILVKIFPRSYPTQHIQIQDQRKVDPLPEDLKRIETESALMAEAKSRWRDIDTPELLMRLPVSGTISGNYGLRRIFNGQPRQPHGGMDIVAPKGTPVHAAAAGQVELVGDFFFNGNTVFIDHGQGLKTVYCHLDTIKVKPGADVTSDMTIGTVGKTGRATGAHLHWGVYLNGVGINPALLLLPEKGSE